MEIRTFRPLKSTSGVFEAPLPLFSTWVTSIKHEDGDSLSLTASSHHLMSCEDNFLSHWNNESRTILYSYFYENKYFSNRNNKQVPFLASVPWSLIRASLSLQFLGRGKRHFTYFPPWRHRANSQGDIRNKAICFQSLMQDTKVCGCNFGTRWPPTDAVLRGRSLVKAGRRRHQPQQYQMDIWGRGCQRETTINDVSHSSERDQWVTILLRGGLAPQ